MSVESNRGGSAALAERSSGHATVELLRRDVFPSKNGGRLHIATFGFFGSDTQPAIFSTHRLVAPNQWITYPTVEPDPEAEGQYKVTWNGIKSSIKSTETHVVEPGVEIVNIVPLNGDGKNYTYMSSAGDELKLTRTEEDQSLPTIFWRRTQSGTGEFFMVVESGQRIGEIKSPARVTVEFSAENEKGESTTGSRISVENGEFLVGAGFVEIAKADTVIAKGESFKAKAKVAITECGQVDEVFLNGYVGLITKFGSPNTDPQPHGINNFRVSGFENRVNGYKVDHLGDYTSKEFAQMTQNQQYYGRYVDFTDPRPAEEVKRWKEVERNIVKSGEEEIARRRKVQAEQAEKARLLEEKRKYLEYLDHILRPQMIPIPTRAEKRRARKAQKLTV